MGPLGLEKQDCGVADKHEPHHHDNFWCTGAPTLPDFIEVTLRVPLHQGYREGAYLSLESDMDTEDVVSWMTCEYPTIAGFFFDYFDADDAKVAVRVRWQGKDEYVEAWRAKE
jgi:hypothetical protein